MRKKTIGKRLWLSHCFVAIGVFLVIIVVFVVYTIHLLLTRINDSNASQLSALMNQVELEIGRMDTVLLNLLYSKTIRENYDDIGTNQQKSWDIMEAMTSINGPRLEVQQINAYTLDGFLVSAGYNNRMMEFDSSGEKWYQPTLAREGRRCIFVPDMDYSAQITTGLGRQRYMSVFRVFYNKYGQPSGIVEVMRDVRYIFRSLDDLKKSSRQQASVFVYEPEGKLIYRQAGMTTLTDLEYGRLIDQQKAGGSNSFRYSVQGHTFRVQMERSEETSWVFVMAMPEQEIYRPFRSFIAIVAALTIVIIPLIFFVSNAVAKRISSPIKQLHIKVAGTTLDNIGDMDWQVDGGTVEVEALAFGFRRMTEQLARSVAEVIEANRQEAQARMVALQAQMNPHFLYNSLTNISVMAEKGMNEGIVEMCGNISFMLRYASSAANPVVTVQDELDYVESYLNCMRIRYGQYLHYSIDMDPGTDQLETIKLVVQPLVENAIRYGVGEDSTWRIKVRSYFEPDDGWRISVRSDGASFDREKLEALHASIRELDKTGSYPALSIKGMGLLNLYSRLRLYFGEAAVFEIHSEQEPGHVTIQIGRRASGKEKKEEQLA